MQKIYTYNVILKYHYQLKVLYAAGSKNSSSLGSIFHMRLAIECTEYYF